MASSAPTHRSRRGQQRPAAAPRDRPPSSRANWLLLITFLLAMAIFALHEAATTGWRPGMGGLHWPLERARATGGQFSQDAAVVGDAGALQASPSFAPTDSAGEMAGPGTEPVVTAEQHDAPLIAVATGSRDPVARADAVTALRQAESTDGIAALGQVVMSDPSPQIRSEAINSLRVLFVNDYDADGAIRAIVLAASSDRDPAVASLARETHREMLGLLPSAAAD